MAKILFQNIQANPLSVLGRLENECLYHFISSCHGRVQKVKELTKISSGPFRIILVYDLEVIGFHKSAGLDLGYWSLIKKLFILT